MYVILHAPAEFRKISVKSHDIKPEDLNGDIQNTHTTNVELPSMSVPSDFGKPDHHVGWMDHNYVCYMSYVTKNASGPTS